MKNKFAAALMSVGLAIGLAGILVSAQGFGFGGPMAVAFFPQLEGINAFLEANDLPPFGDVLLGGGGLGRGGAIGGMSAGGIGWGIVADSESGARHAELVFGGGGLDLGCAVGGDTESVLTIGAVLGAGASVLSMTPVPVPVVERDGASPAGIIPEPDEWEFGRVVGFVEPYVSFEVQVLNWLGFELRLGYLLPVLGFDFGGIVGVSSPALDLSGPVVSFGLTFGGIGSGGIQPQANEPEVTTTSGGTFVLDDLQILSVENKAGDIVVTTYEFDPTQTDSRRVIEWAAEKTSRPSEAREVAVQKTEGPQLVTLKTVCGGRVDLRLQVPSGTNLELHDAAGRIEVDSLSADSLVAEVGAGEVSIQGFSGVATVVAVGVGNVRISDADALKVVTHIGIGSIVVDLPSDASATIDASVGLGDVAFDDFPAMTGGTSGFLSKSGHVVLGDGATAYDLRVGLGEIGIRRLTP
jgi:hypothetical protein